METCVVDNILQEHTDPTLELIERQRREQMELLKYFRRMLLRCEGQTPVKVFQAC